MRLFVIFVSLLVLVTSTLAVQSFNSKSLKVIEAENELQLSLKKISKTKRFMHDLNAHVRRLQNQVRTGRTLRKTLRKKIDPMVKLKGHIRSIELRDQRLNSAHLALQNSKTLL